MRNVISSFPRCCVPLAEAPTRQKRVLSPCTRHLPFHRRVDAARHPSSYFQLLRNKLDNRDGSIRRRRVNCSENEFIDDVSEKQDAARLALVAASQTDVAVFVHKI